MSDSLSDSDPCTAACQASLSITNSQSLFKLMSIESVMPSNHLILCRPLLLLPSIFPSIRVSSNESVLCIRYPKCWSFSISPSNEYLGLIFFRIDWFDILAVFSNTTVQKHQFFRAQLSLWSNMHTCWSHMHMVSHAYMTTRKTIALTRWIFVSKVTSLLFEVLSRFAINIYAYRQQTGKA